MTTQNGESMIVVRGVSRGFEIGGEQLFGR